MNIEISRTLKNWSTQHRLLFLIKNECIYHTMHRVTFEYLASITKVIEFY